jgi:hypothetical protein
MNSGQFLIGLSIYLFLSGVICYNLASYLVDKDKDELAYMVTPFWAILSMLILGIYLS